MKTAILVPGRPDKFEYYDPKYPSNSNNHWFPWLTKHLMMHDIHTVAIELPKPWQPRYDIWKKEFERFDVGKNTILVGHSCGGGFLVRWLSENKDITVGTVVLVAPWLNPENNPLSDTADFFEFEIDPNVVSRTQAITIFNSDNDQSTIHESVDIIRQQIKGIGYKEFHNHGHFCLEDLGTEEFPELLDFIVTSDVSVTQ
jgi:predicted alpha/beta hydrolase family esterase